MGKKLDLLLGLEPGLSVSGPRTLPQGQRVNGGLLVVAKGSVQGKPADGARLHLACTHRGTESYATEHWGQWWQMCLVSIGPGWTVGRFSSHL